MANGELSEAHSGAMAISELRNLHQFAAFQRRVMRHDARNRIRDFRIFFSLE